MVVDLLLFPLLLQAPEARGGAALQQASLQRQLAAASVPQKQSVRRQMAALHPETKDIEPEFFTVPWASGDAAPPAVAAPCDPLPPGDIDPILTEMSRRQRLQPELLREVIRKESGFRPCAVSPAGAQGLMQLMPETQRSFAVNDPFDPRQSIEAGARFLRQLLDRYNGDLALALGAYNAGPALVDKAKGIPPIPETQDYVAGILKRVNRD
ncbi:MAG: lytic transglycosylase domain-containing protein [Bryobacteraceae bacterium]|nr:lytic transglycosylase domain-containing protein [Bryobacteraceae bacterium]